MMGMAYHLCFNCDNHFARRDQELVMQYYNPQRQARHTVDHEKLFTDTELESAIARLSADDVVDLWITAGITFR